MTEWFEQPYQGGKMIELPGFPRSLFPPDAAEQGQTPSPGGPDVIAYKRTVARLGRWKWDPDGWDDAYSNPFAHGKEGGAAGESGMAGVQRQAGISPATGWVGEQTFNLLRSAKIPEGLPHAGEPALDAVARDLLVEAWKQSQAKQVPALPTSFSHPAVPPYVQGSGWMGLQPWIVPQVKAIVEHFGLQVTEGFGGHPPHGVHSDHGWGGAVDLAGPMEAMVACNLWADGHCADPFRPGKIFRWVGGPAKDSSGVEPGHDNHVHLSWYRTGPATTIFETPEFH